jgi:hypothetical protein
MRKSIAGFIGAALIAAAITLAEFDPQLARPFLWGVIYVGVGILALIGLSYLPWPKLAKRVSRSWQIRDGLRYQPAAFPLQDEQGPVIGVALTEPKELRADSVGSFWIANPKLREQAVQCVIGADAVTPSYRMGTGWVAHIPDDFENTPLEIGTYEAQWVVEGVPTVTHRFKWDGQTIHTRFSILDRMKDGLRSLLRWISSL